MALRLFANGYNGLVGGKVGNHPDYQTARNAHVAERENVATQTENHALTYTKS